MSKIKTGSLAVAITIALFAMQMCSKASSVQSSASDVGTQTATVATSSVSTSTVN